MFGNDPKSENVPKIQEKQRKIEKLRKKFEGKNAYN